MIARSETGRVHGPRWMLWLGHLAGQKNVQGLELGTFRGSSAEFFLDNICTHPTSHLSCVDWFQGSDEHKAKGIDVSDTFDAATKTLSRFNKENYSIRKIESHHHLLVTGSYLLTSSPEDFPGYDFIYVDADHSARGVLRDGVLSWESLKVGGIMIFDDYRWRDMPKPIDCPAMGIDAFLECYAKQLTVIHRGNQVAIKKIMR